jgi:hypothetical protein
MQRNKKILKDQLQEFSKNELIEIVLKLSGRKEIYDYVRVNYTEKGYGEQSLFDETLEEIEELLYKAYKGRTPQHQACSKIKALNKRLKEFTDISKNKKLEADLLLHILEHFFGYETRFWARDHASFDYKVALLLERFIKVITQQLHPDYLVDYSDKANLFLKKIHYSSDHLQTVCDMPMKIE